jgi:hypothetical protein
MAMKPCGECKHYWAVRKAERNKVPRKLHSGPCLKRSVYPSNRVGDIVFPPGAILENLPNMRAKIFMVHESQVMTTCPWWNKKAEEEK